MRDCKECQTTKPDTDFYGASRVCKPCNNTKLKRQRAMAAFESGKITKPQVQYLAPELQAGAQKKVEEATAKKKQQTKDYNQRRKELYQRARDALGGKVRFTDDEALAVLATPEEVKLAQGYAKQLDQQKARHNKGKQEQSGAYKRKKEMTKTNDKERAQKESAVRKKIKWGEEAKLSAKEQKTAKRIEDKKQAMYEVPEVIDLDAVQKKAEELVAQDPGLELESVLHEVYEAWKLPAGERYEKLRKYVLADQAKRREREQSKAYKMKKKLFRAMDTRPKKKYHYAVDREKAAAKSKAWREANPGYKPASRIDTVRKMINNKINNMDPVGKDPNVWKQVECSPATFLREFLKCSCVYCGSSADIGVDRIDSDLSYVIDNIVPCCHDCNMTKSDQSADGYLAKCSQESKTALCQRVAGHQQTSPFSKELVEAIIASIKDKAEAKQIQVNEGVLKSRKAPTDYKNGRDPAQGQVVIISNCNNVYHTPKELTDRLCLKSGGEEKKFMSDPVSLPAMDALARDHRPCRICRLQVTPNEYAALTDTKEIAEEIQEYLTHAEDPFYHRGQCKYLFAYDVEYTKVEVRPEQPLWRCRHCRPSGPEPSPEQQKKAGAIRRNNAAKLRVRAKRAGRL